jgi:hypothetical protein
MIAESRYPSSLVDFFSLVDRADGSASHLSALEVVILLGFLERVRVRTDKHNDLALAIACWWLAGPSGGGRMRDYHDESWSRAAAATARGGNCGDASAQGQGRRAPGDLSGERRGPVSVYRRAHGATGFQVSGAKSADLTSTC